MFRKQRLEIGDIVEVNDIYRVFGNNLQHIIVDITTIPGSRNVVYKLISTKDLKQGKIKIYESIGELLWKVSE